MKVTQENPFPCTKAEAKLDRQRTSYVRMVGLAIPLVVQGFVFILTLLVDRLLMARYDMVQFAAVGLAGWSATAIFFFFYGTINFASNMVAQHFGAKRISALAEPVWVALLLAVMFSVIMLASIPLGQQLFRSRIFQLDAQLVEYVIIYFTLVMIAHTISLFTTALMSFFAGIGHTFKLMVITIAGNAVNILFGWLLIFGQLGLPSMGIAGAGIASILSSVTSLLIVIILIIVAARDYPVLLKPSIKWRQLIRLITTGAPAGLEMGLEMSGFAILKLALGRISAQAVGAAGISFSLLEFVDAPLDALAAATAIIIGQERGALRFHNLNRIVRRAITLALSYSVIMMVVFWFFSSPLINIFSGDSEYAYRDEVHRLARIYLWLTMIWLIPNAILTVYSQTLKALGDSRYLAVWNVGATFSLIILPSLWLMQQPWWWVEYAIYAVTIPYVVMMTFILHRRYHGGVWRDLHITD